MEFFKLHGRLPPSAIEKFKMLKLPSYHSVSERVLKDVILDYLLDLYQDLYFKRMLIDLLKQNNFLPNYYEEEDKWAFLAYDSMLSQLMSNDHLK